MKINLRESLGRLDLLTDNKYDLRNTYDSSNLSNDKKKKLAESISKNASAKQIYNILNETFNEDGVNVTEKISDDVRDGMFGGLIGKDTEWEVFFESGPTDILDSDIEDMANDISNGKLSGKTNNGVGWQIRVHYGDDFYDYNCLNCPEDDYVGSRWEEYDESLTEDIDAKYCAEIYDREDYDEFEDEIVRLGRTGYICTNDLDEFINKVQKEVKNGKYVNIKDRYGEYTQLMMKYSYYDCDDEIVDDIYHALDIDVPLYKIVCVNDEFDDLDVDWVLVNALSHDDAEKVAEHFGYKWTEDGLDWDMVIEEDNESRDRRYLNNNYDQIGKISVYGESLKESASDSDEYEREHIIRLVKAVKEASKRKGMNISNLKKTAKRYIENHKDTKNKKELDELIKAYKSLDDKEECLKEDTVKQNGKWVNKGEEGTHGKFKTKKAADAQRKAMFANGYKGESFEDKEKNESYIPDDADVKKDMVMFTAMVHKGDAWDEALYNLGYVCDDPGCTTWTKSVSDGDIVVIIEPNDDEYTIENSTIYCSKLDNNGNVVYEKSFNVFSDEWLNEDWEPDEWEETDFLDDDGKKVYINIIKEAEDIDDLKDIAHDLYWHDKGLFAMLRHFPKDKSFEWIQNRMIEVIKSTMNESLTEASYGGAYDIEDDMFWTKDDLIEFSDAVCEKLADKFGYQYDIADVGAESNNDMYILIEDTTHGIEADVSFRIKMSRIRAPRDLMKYLDTVVAEFVKKFEKEYQYYEFDESLNEDMSAVMDDFAYARRNWDRIGTGVSLDDALEEYNAQYGQEGFYARPLYSESEWNKMVNMFADVETMTEAVDDEEIDLDVETDFNDGEVEEGDTFIEDGREWSWIERIAGPIHLDFDNWAVWSARDWDYIQEKIKPILLNKEELTVETLTKIYDEAEVAYFVVDEDTGFIDWGPVESQTEAQDFLNGKVEDWENDEYDESLQESKDLKERWTVDLDYEDIGSYGYTYEADGEEVVDYLTQMLYENGEYPDFLEDKSDEEINAWLDDKENYPKFRDWVEENIDDLLKKYEYDVLEYFEDDAIIKYDDEHEDDDWGYGPDNGSGMTDRDFL